jgi:hypothetical protein
MLKINTIILNKTTKMHPKDKIFYPRIRGSYPGMFIFYPWGITEQGAAVVVYIRQQRVPVSCGMTLTQFFNRVTNSYETGQKGTTLAAGEKVFPARFIRKPC